MTNKFQFAIDRGGTFTDIYARCPGGKIRVMKLLSVDPANYEDAPREGIRRILEEETGKTMPASESIDTDNIDWIRMGTTVATNALLERKGERMALLVTKGFKDLLYIGNQSRPKLFDLKIQSPSMLYEEVVEVEERVVLAQDSCQLQHNWPVVEGTTKEKLLISNVVNWEKLETDLLSVKAKGISSLAVVLMHSYMFAGHEEAVGRFAKKLGFQHVSLSSQVMPMVKIVPRGFTVATDTYLTPLIKKYVEGFASGFKNNLQGVNVLFMQSDGGLTPMNEFCGSRAILSGPAGGVVGYATTTFDSEKNIPVIGFDMGGTSTDVSRFSGEYEHVFETTTAGVTIQAPQLDVNTVAAGGGSVLQFRSGLFVVGPESAGAHPGPVCYKKGGPLTVTDANLILGRLLPDFFPKLFGPKENEPLDSRGTVAAFEKLRADVNTFLAASDGKKMTVQEIALGFVRVANETMCRPIRSLTQGRGYDTSQHVLACFGGAGGQHACAIARNLGISTVFIHRYAGILSAYGMARADVVKDLQEPCNKSYSAENFSYIDSRISQLKELASSELEAQGYAVTTIPYLHMRYEGTDCAIMVTTSSDKATPDTSVHGDFLSAFLSTYKVEFGFLIENREVIVDNVRVRGVGRVSTGADPSVPEKTGPPSFERITKVYFEEDCFDTPVYLLSKLKYGHDILGPAVIIDNLSTILVEPHCTARIDMFGNISISIGSGNQKKVGKELDTVQLSIFSHRFMSIAEQMGRVLQRTSISTNIKERLDFSCALFGPDGSLVSNAPHIPVHLGAMQETVQYQLQHLTDNLHRGDVILCNHPSAGGSHLPDMTVITPVFLDNEVKPQFFVANRGHHADIGGITPGSMPPHSRLLSEEGACFKSFKLVDRGQYQEEALIKVLMTPTDAPGSSGTRCLNDNLSDLRAQIAANQKGINLVTELINYYGLDVVHAYMHHIQENARVAVEDMLKEIGKQTMEKTGKSTLFAEDYMDDGTPIRVTISIDVNKGNAIVDFRGTGQQVWGNCNAPRAITVSALIYCLRCLVGQDIPLNQGCLNPIKLIVPKGSILDPIETAAVVGGNVLTSQRIVDVILKAFQACAASQGCMNNITFGDETMGYYETVAGGAGAGSSWHGHSGIHTHMTNTRITDPEILERRYPVVLQQFSLNPDTGGNGRFKGGDGVTRHILFRKPLTLSVLTERRVFQPYGLNGGAPGSRGLNLLVQNDGNVFNVGSKNSVAVKAGDSFLLHTPGGGGYGKPDQDATDAHKEYERKSSHTFIERGSLHEYKMAQESV